ncbi:hypothetical protein [Ralstonia sp. SET104]|uniref:hypothetical protein n=1 Tax=Ralstonia sp. SET104 TaxID=2448774 RepID=UPI000F5671F7|nr:hypothetical protein [Ralstonia sp. SET104]GCB06748.1 hypothetical protein PSUB009319_43790 [Ralstonia sp. SET104]
MRAVLVPFDGARYLAVDQVALARTVAALLPLIPVANDSDSYCLEQTLRPLLERAVNYQVNAPVSSRSEVIGTQYFHERREGTLPEIFTLEFHAALSRFLVRVMSMPLEEPELQTIDGKTWALMEMEEPGDWPDKVKYE